MKIILPYFFSLVLGIYGGFVYEKTFEPNQPFNVLEHARDEGPYMEFSDMTGSIGEETLSKLPHVESIRFNGGNFKHLDFKAFTKMPQLKELALNEVMVPMNITNEDIKAISTLKEVLILFKKDDKNSDISEDAFKDTKLEKIVVSSTKIKRLTKARLTGLKNLKELTFEFCDIEKIDQDAFKDVPNLEKIILLGNKFTIELGTFDHLSNIRILKIENSGLTEFNWDLLKNLKNLEILSLYLNNIHSVETPKEGIFFNNLEEIDMGLNKINKIDWQFLGVMPNLRKLDLSNNDIMEIKNTVIKGEMKLEELELDSNDIKNIEWDFFKNLPHLKILELEQNSLKSVDSDKLSAYLKNLKRLNLWSNLDLDCDIKREVRKKLTEANEDVEVKINYPRPGSRVPKNEKCG